MSRKVNTAFSLVELMISLFLGALLCSIVLQQYSALSSQSKFLTQALHQTMEESLSIDLLRESTNSAGFTPFGPVHTLQEVSTGSNQVHEPIAALMPLKNGFVSRRMSAEIVPLLQSNGVRISVAKMKRIRKNLTIMIVNWCCYQIANVMSVQIINDQMQLVLDSIVHDTFKKNSYVGLWIEEQFMVLQSTQQQGLYYTQRHLERLHSQWRAWDITQLSILEGSLSIRYRNVAHTPHLFYSRLSNAKR